MLLGNGIQVQICRFGLPDDDLTYFNPFSLHKQTREKESYMFVINVKIWVKLVSGKSCWGNVNFNADNMLVTSKLSQIL